MSISYDINENYNCVIFKLSGKIMGGPDANAFRDDLEELLDKDRKNIIFDLSNVKFMNSSGLGILIGGLKRVNKAGGDLKICGATDRIKSLLMVSQLTKIFDTYDTLEKAVETYQE